MKSLLSKLGLVGIIALLTGCASPRSKSLTQEEQAEALGLEEVEYGNPVAVIIPFVGKGYLYREKRWELSSRKNITYNINIYNNVLATNDSYNSSELELKDTTGTDKSILITP